MIENDIEQFAIDLLCKQGFTYIHGAKLTPDVPDSERGSYEQVILKKQLAHAINRINPTISHTLQQDAIKTIERIHTTELLADNEKCHYFLTEGVPVSTIFSGQERGDRVWPIDFDHIANNNFVVVNQFTVIENERNRRPDLIIFINGLPVVVMELKNPTNEKTTITSAFNQIETYKKQIPSLFMFNAFNIISDGLEAKAGSLSANLERYAYWRSSDGHTKASKLQNQLEVLIKGMLNQHTLLDIIRHFIVFEKNQRITIKKLAAYHQYYAVNKAVDSTLRASGFLSHRNHTTHGDKKGGVVWHTPGVGKSLTMVFYTGKIVQCLNNPTVVVITDRNDLDDQLFGTFSASMQLLRQTPKQAETCNQLKKYLKVASGGIIFSTIQKFQLNEGHTFECLSDRKNIVVIADEAHRTQYGFQPKTIDVKNANGEVIGKKVAYGFAKYMRDALPNATYIGFTGTPIEKKDVNTPLVFGHYVDIYDISQAVEDGVIVPIFYESRLAKISLSDEGKKLLDELDQALDQKSTETQKIKEKQTRFDALMGGTERINDIAKDIVSHFTARQEVFDGKGMVVSASRPVAVKLYEAIIQRKPEWHSDDLHQGFIKIVMHAQASDGSEISHYHTTKAQRQLLAQRMRNNADILKIVIVVDMWLTGFDVPSLHTLYIDKPMKDHNLMQAMTRVNRVYKDKPSGLIVDYLGVASDLKKSLSFYAESGGTGDLTHTQEEAIKLMLEKMEILQQMFYGFDYASYFDADTGKKLSIILAAEDYILGLDNGKKRFINAVTALSQVFVIIITHQKAQDIREEVGFFQAVKARLSKFETSEHQKNNQEIETTIKQVIDKALVSDRIIDVFDAAGIKKPEISILSDDFLMELKGMQHKNIALETIKKLLNNEIKSRSRTNLINSRTLRDMLESSIKKYQNRLLTAAEVIEKLIQLAKEVVKSDQEPSNLGLSTHEYAFYTAVADNESARDLMQKEQLKKLSIVLTERVRKNVSIDWTIKESVRSKLKVTVKRTLREFGYPPDMQKLATETVLKQAEMLADELTTSY